MLKCPIFVGDINKMEGLYTMSDKEIKRLEIIQKCISKELPRRIAEKILNIGDRQLRRLINNYLDDGAQGLISKHRGKISGNKISDETRVEVLKLVKDKYCDFGPTLAHEYITESYPLKFSVETLRQWMISDGIWKAKSKKCRVHQSRDRRACYGELIQIDGSQHDWFEGRGDKCSLLVFIDDATSKLMLCYFAPSESTQSYMSALSQYLDIHGKPLALYSDMHGVFKVNHKDKEHQLTQFGRALKELDIEPIFAKTPQAKGRVERANKTLQDRLVKELRLNNICNIEQANKFLPEFIEKYNARFAVEPRSKQNLHQPVKHTQEEKKRILSIQEPRILTKNLTISYNSKEFQLVGYGKGYRLQHKTITVCNHFDGNIELCYQGKILEYRCFEKGKAPIISSRKELESVINNIKQKKQMKYKPAKNHPWRRYKNNYNDNSQNSQNRTF